MNLSINDMRKILLRQDRTHAQCSSARDPVTSDECPLDPRLSYAAGLWRDICARLSMDVYVQLDRLANPGYSGPSLAALLESEHERRLREGENRLRASWSIELRRALDAERAGWEVYMAPDPAPAPDPHAPKPETIADRRLQAWLARQAQAVPAPAPVQTEPVSPPAAHALRRQQVEAEQQVVLAERETQRRQAEPVLGPGPALVPLPRLVLTPEDIRQGNEAVQIIEATRGLGPWIRRIQKIDAAVRERQV